MDAIRPIDINYNQTQKLGQIIAHPRSLAQRVAAIAAIAFVAIAETLRNLFAYPINAGIWALNRCFETPKSDKPETIETAEYDETPDASAPTLPLTKTLSETPDCDTPTPKAPEPTQQLRYEPVESYEPVEGTPDFDAFMEAQKAPRVELRNLAVAAGTAIYLTAKVGCQVVKLAWDSIPSCRRQKHVRFADVAQQNEFDSRQILPETTYPQLKA